MKLPLLAIAISFAAPALAAPPVEVMVLGAYHFGNPGLDTNNIQVDSVLTPRSSGSSIGSPERWRPSSRRM